MSGLRRLAVGMILLGVIGSESSYGQLTAALKDVRGKSSFTAADREKIAKEVEAILQKIADAPSQRDRVKLRKEFINIWGGLSSLNFKDEFTGILSKGIEARIQKDPGEGVMLVLMAMKEYKHDRTIGAMRAGLKHPAAEVRMHAVQGIRGLWSELSGAPAQQTIQELIATGQKEKDWVVCREIYHALAAAGNSSAAVPALLTVFEARLKGYDKRAGWRAELVLLDYFQSRLGDLTPETRIRLIKDLALLLAQTVPQYLKEAKEATNSSGNATLQERLIGAHVLFDAAERLLTGLVKDREQRVPNLRKAIRQGARENADAIQFELNEWVGVGDTAGVLNKPPYDVPKGGGVPKAASETEGKQQPTTVPTTGPANKPAAGSGGLGLQNKTRTV